LKQGQVIENGFFALEDTIFFSQLGLLDEFRALHQREVFNECLHLLAGEPEQIAQRIGLRRAA